MDRSLVVSSIIDFPREILLMMMDFMDKFTLRLFSNTCNDAHDLLPFTTCARSWSEPRDVLRREWVIHVCDQDGSTELMRWIRVGRACMPCRTLACIALAYTNRAADCMEIADGDFPLYSRAFTPAADQGHVDFIETLVGAVPLSN